DVVECLVRHTETKVQLEPVAARGNRRYGIVNRPNHLIEVVERSRKSSSIALCHPESHMCFHELWCKRERPLVATSGFRMVAFSFILRPEILPALSLDVRETAL